MKYCLADHLRYIATLPEGEVIKKFKPAPKKKPPRRQPSLKNKTDDAHYMRDYMRQYQEEGKGYQKMPESVKKRRLEQKSGISPKDKKLRP